MKAALLYGIKDLRVVDIPRPAVGPGDVLVRVSACGVCPTDLRKYRTGDAGALQFPMNLGHEWIGQVAAVGQNVRGFREGMRVLGDTFSGFADYAPISAEALQFSFPNGPLSIPASLSDDELTFVEPLADCIHAVEDQARVEPGQTVAILGAGQMGLQIAALACARGAQVIVSEPRAERRQLALELGATTTIDPSSQELVDEINRLTGGAGADAVILAIGIPALVNQAFRAVRKLGRIVLFAGFNRPAVAQIDPNLIHYKEMVVVGSHWFGVPPRHRPELYQQAIDRIADGTVPVKRFITHRFQLDDINQAFAAAATSGAMKVLIRMDLNIDA